MTSVHTCSVLRGQQAGVAGLSYESVPNSIRAQCTIRILQLLAKWVKNLCCDGPVDHAQDILLFFCSHQSRGRFRERSEKISESWVVFRLDLGIKRGFPRAASHWRQSLSGLELVDSHAGLSGSIPQWGRLFQR